MNELTSDYDSRFRMKYDLLSAMSRESNAGYPSGYDTIDTISFHKHGPGHAGTTQWPTLHKDFISNQQRLFRGRLTILYSKGRGHLRLHPENHTPQNRCSYSSSFLILNIFETGSPSISESKKWRLF